MIDRDRMLDKINEASNYLKENFNSKVSSAIILGSGMGGFENSFKPIATFDYSKIPNHGDKKKVKLSKLEEKFAA